jgi:3,2-trans-enoyl-CoA isomerase
VSPPNINVLSYSRNLIQCEFHPFSFFTTHTHSRTHSRNEALCTSIQTLESNPKIQSVILSSSNPKIFSAGLDVSELISPNSDRLPKFWNSLQQLYLDLYGSRLAIVAAIQGHAPAAGCFLAMACDYRIMSGGDTGGGGGGADSDMKKRFVPTIGLNETQLGIAGEYLFFFVEMLSCIFS